MASDRDSANADELSALWQECALDLARLRAEMNDEAQAREKAEAELQRTRRELDALNAVSAAISGSLELPEVLTTLRRQLSEQLNIPGGCVYLHHPESGSLQLAASWGLPDKLLALPQSVPLDAFHNQEIVRKRAAAVCGDARELSYFAELKAEDAALRGYCGVSLYADGAIQGVLEVFGAEAFREEQISFFTALGQQVGVAVYRARLFEQIYEGRERLRALSHRLVAVQEEERRHIARELHDEVGQLLTGLKLTLEMSARGTAETMRANLADAQQLVAELMSKVRQMSLDLRPGMLDDLGLLSALLWHFERFTAQTGVRVRFTQAGIEGVRFSPEVETAAYRIVQEALTNAARHGQIAEVGVHLRADESILTVQVEDRGCGFNPKDALAARRSSGVAGMGERAQLLGGGLTIESLPGAGTTITANLPLWDGTEQGD